MPDARPGVAEQDPTPWEHSRGTLAIVGIFGLLFGLGWLAMTAIATAFAAAICLLPAFLAVVSRGASFLVTTIFVLVGRHLRAVPAPVLAIAAFAGCLDITGSTVFIRAAQSGRLDQAVILSSLYPAVTVLLARLFLDEHFSRARTVGMLAAIAAVPMIAR